MAGGQLRRFHRPDPPAFFKVVQRPLNQGMEIPTTFSRLRGDLLDGAAAVRLIDPVGKTWWIGLSREAGGRIWLRSGLEDFGQFYGVRLYHFLFFRAVGTARFRVRIIDRSMTEIDYHVGEGDEIHRPEPPRFYHVVGNSNEQELIIPAAFVRKFAKRFENEEVVTLIDPAGTTTRALQQTRGNGEAWLRTCWKEFGRFYSLRWPDLVLFMLDGKSRYQVTIFDETATEIDYRLVSNPLTVDQNAGAGTSLTVAERVNAFRSERPFFYSFTTSASIRTFVHIPQDYVREHYEGREGFEHVLLRLPLPMRRRWNVMITLNGRQKRIRTGWRDFAAENELLPGNACVFEWHEDEGAFTVHIYR